MDRLKLEFKLPKSKIIEYNGVEIELTPFLGTVQQITLISRYVMDYFNIEDNQLTIPQDKYNSFVAEINMINYIMQMCTNIETGNLEPDIYADPRLVEVITSNIINFWDFRTRLEKTVSEIKEQEVLDKSLGQVIEKLGIKLADILETFASFAPEDVDKVKDTALTLLAKLEDSSILKNSLPANSIPLTAKKTRKKN